MLTDTSPLIYNNEFDYGNNMAVYYDGYNHFTADKYNSYIAPTLTHTHTDSDREEKVRFASERIFALISEENDLRNNRMTWFATIQGFLWLSFVAMASREGDLEPRETLLWMILVSLIGILVCLSAISAIIDADRATKLLREKWKVIQCLEQDTVYAYIPVIGLTPEESTGLRIPRWSFALFILIGWVTGIIGTVISYGNIQDRRLFYYLITISLCVVLCWVLASIIREIIIVERSRRR